MKQTMRRTPKSAPEIDEMVYDRLSNALMEGKLRAGTKLAEHKLADALGVSRERVRKALHRLAADRRIDIIPNRGARVPSPSAEEIRAVYQAHRTLEAGVLLQLGTSLSEAMLTSLEQHLHKERDAARANDRALSVRLSGEFHILLVDALDNAELSRFIRDLLSRSSIMVSLYEHSGHSACGVDEHAAIVEALRKGDPMSAVALSRDHFTHVQERLDFPAADSAPVNFQDIFQS
ncbi:GntR family transcriptional regulator [Roseibium marinum]|nr:GntR family transcriptional regulator [Roseibium marinum]